MIFLPAVTMISYVIYGEPDPIVSISEIPATDKAHLSPNKVKHKIGKDENKAYIIYGEPDAPILPIVRTCVTEKAPLPPNRPKVRKDDKQITRLWHSEHAIIHGSSQKKAPPSITRMPRPNKGLKLRIERNRRLESKPRPQPPVLQSTKLSSVNRSLSYTLPAPSMTGVPYIRTASKLIDVTEYREPQYTRTVIRFALIWSTWEGIKRGLQIILSPLTRIFYSKTFADKSTSTRNIRDIDPEPIKARVDSWQKGRPKVLQSKPSSMWKPSNVSRSECPGLPGTANISRVTRDRKTKVVTVWTVEKKKTARSKAAAAPQIRRWRC